MDEFGNKECADKFTKRKREIDCCFVGCNKKATKGIYSEKERDNDTYACNDHVTDLANEDDTVLDIEIDG